MCTPEVFLCFQKALVFDNIGVLHTQKMSSLTDKETQVHTLRFFSQSISECRQMVRNGRPCTADTDADHNLAELAFQYIALLNCIFFIVTVSPVALLSVPGCAIQGIRTSTPARHNDIP